MNISKTVVLLMSGLLFVSPQAFAKEAQTEKKAPQATKSKISSWNINGSMAARHGKRGWNANVNWRQNGASNYRIMLNGPVAGSTVVITKSGGTTTWQEGGRKMVCSNPAQMLQKETGIWLPINSLYYWVRGEAAPGGVQMEKRDAQNRLVTLRQSGYTINYSNYSNNLPGKISMNGNGTSIKFVIRGW